MKRTLLFVLALAVIPVGVDAQAPDLEETRASAEQGNPIAQYNLGLMYANGRGVPRNDAQAPDLEETRASPAPPATPRTAQITACSSSAPITCSR